MSGCLSCSGGREEERLSGTSGPDNLLLPRRILHFISLKPLINVLHVTFPPEDFVLVVKLKVSISVKLLNHNDIY